MHRPRDTNLRRKVILSFVELRRKKPINGGGGLKEAEKKTDGYKRNPQVQTSGCGVHDSLSPALLQRLGSAARLHDLATGISASEQDEFQTAATKLNDSCPFATNLPRSRNCPQPCN